MIDGIPLWCFVMAFMLMVIVLRVVWTSDSDNK
jgi:hypothetical protein